MGAFCNVKFDVEWYTGISFIYAEAEEMSVSLGRGRASLLKRSVSTEPQRSSPGGLQDAHPTTSPPPTSSNPSPIKNIKPKLRTFQKPRPLKSRNPTSTSPLVIPDSNNNSCSSSQGDYIAVLVIEPRLVIDINILNQPWFGCCPWQTKMMHRYVKLS